MALAVWSTRGWLNPEWAENWAVENAREVAGLERGCSRERAVKHECRSHQVATAATGMQLKWNRAGDNTTATETQRGKWTVTRLRFSGRCLQGKQQAGGQGASSWRPEEGENTAARTLALHLSSKHQQPCQPPYNQRPS